MNWPNPITLGLESIWYAKGQKRIKGQKGNNLKMVNTKGRPFKVILKLCLYFLNSTLGGILHYFRKFKKKITKRDIRHRQLYNITLILHKMHKLSTQQTK